MLFWENHVTSYHSYLKDDITCGIVQTLHSLKGTLIPLISVKNDKQLSNLNLQKHKINVLIVII